MIFGIGIQCYIIWDIDHYKEITSSAAVVEYSENEEDVVYAGKHNEQMVEGVRHLHLNGFFVTWYRPISSGQFSKMCGYFGILI